MDGFLAAGLSCLDEPASPGERVEAGLFLQKSVFLFLLFQASSFQPKYCLVP
jgi:hypothetical protein